MLVELVMFLCINVSFVIIEYKFVFVRRLILNVHFVHVVLQPLFASYLLLICFIDFLHLPLYPCAHNMLYSFICVYPCAYSNLILN